MINYYEKSHHSLLHSAGLTHQEGFAEVAPGFLTDLFGQFGGQEQTLLFTHRCQYTADLEVKNKLTSRTNIYQILNPKTVPTLLTSSVLGRGTLTARQRLLIGSMTLEVDVEQRMMRQVDMYFSIVRRKACWASFVSLSTSVSNTTERRVLIS